MATIRMNANAAQAMLAAAKQYGEARGCDAMEMGVALRNRNAS